MSSNRSRRTAVAALVAAVLVGGGLTAITPAGAEVADAVATNWKKVWKKKLRPLADKRYYSKSQTDAKYSTKTETSSLLGNYYTKAQSDGALGNYYNKAQSDANYYSKSQSDAKYAPYPSLMRGAWALGAAPAGNLAMDAIDYSATLSAAPAPHYIPVGGALPVGCTGNAANPGALAGHLCVFASESSTAATPTICASGAVACSGASPFGAMVYAATGGGWIYGSWAVRPIALAAPAARISAGEGARGPDTNGVPGE